MVGNNFITSILFTNRLQIGATSIVGLLLLDQLYYTHKTNNENELTKQSILTRS